MEKQAKTAGPIETLWPNSFEQVMPHKIGIRMIVDESQEIGSAEPVSCNQMGDTELWKNAEIETN
jgi:hypothetical protein